MVRYDQVLMVCRRGDDGAGITWQFPAGVIKPGGHPETTAVRETFAETGVRVDVQQRLGERLHPVTGVHCVYLLCSWLAGEASNVDIEENLDVMWVDRPAVTRFVAAGSIYPPILVALEAP